MSEPGHSTDGRDLTTDVGMFRNTILPLILLVWGAAIAVNVVVSGPDGSGAYAGGQLAAGAFGVVLVAAAVRHLVRSR